MSKKPIILIDDDIDDIELYEMALADLNTGHRLISFGNGQSFLDFMKKTNEKFLFIVCDLNMPRLDGFEIKRRLLLHEDLDKKSIPFLFWSTSNAPDNIDEAYDLHSQGYFVKPTNMDEMKKLVAGMITYWSLCYHPNSPERISGIK